MLKPRLYVAALLIGAASFALPGASLGAGEDASSQTKPSTTAKKSPTPSAKKPSSAAKKSSSAKAKKDPTPAPKKSSAVAASSKKSSTSKPSSKKNSASNSKKSTASKPDTEKTVSKTTGSKQSNGAEASKSQKSKAKPKPATQKRRSKSHQEHHQSSSRHSTASQAKPEKKAEPEKKTVPKKKQEPEKKPEPRASEEEHKPEAHSAASSSSSRSQPPGQVVFPARHPAAPQTARTAVHAHGDGGSQATQSVVVTKSGIAGEEEAPLPTPVPERRRWWWPFGHSHGAHYKYLSPRVREAIDDARVPAHKWRYIVVHNSGTRQGSAKAFDYYHRYVRKMPNGLAYHFVIGNGTSTPDGYIEIGSRWTQQLQGGHVHSDYLNSIALGVCLVGDYNKDVPTQAQLEALDELIKYLRRRVGKTDHHLAVVVPHRDINPPRWPTDCPGDRFPYQWLKSDFDQ